jgi:hypothetical protein
MVGTIGLRFAPVSALSDDDDADTDDRCRLYCRPAENVRTLSWEPPWPASVNRGSSRAGVVGVG